MLKGKVNSQWHGQTEKRYIPLAFCGKEYDMKKPE